METEKSGITPNLAGNTPIVVDAERTAERERQAIVVRKQWMRMMGLSEAEIIERCDTTKYPAVLEQELEELAAMQRVEELNR